ncbi:sensor histidine kinase [Kibdelosporangium phytohabitans]|uniref:histidine kinase n=1 Tax=Kibdelosporangium phytohabitans TaxID=860235 RepID=A0A0N9I7K9_9PSEU|nr:ATP-binding protein [Kibdelosporangium phytohabitans]ALG14204.1 histidine kinase [Kibdelosporangium phytohabitans]MBE1466800.1 sensor histidine kinase regulating citrate/malate metabolism [Kibdelosporangium phytohabitans]
MGVKGSLARQLLAWQVVIVIALLTGVAVFSAIQANENFMDVAGRRMLLAAENLAATPTIRGTDTAPGVDDDIPGALSDPLRYQQLPSFAESTRAFSGADLVVLARPDLTVVSATTPGLTGSKLAVGSDTITRSWVGVIGDSLVAHVPVMDNGSHVIGIVAVSVETPGFFAGIIESPADALVALGLATVLGVFGSLLLAQRVKKQTLGLEPAEITALVEQREAMLHGIREGVVGLDGNNRIVLVNDRAKALLSIPGDSVGTAVSDLDFNERMTDVLTGRAEGADQIVLRRGRVLTMNRMPISLHDKSIGSVVTMRDRTEMVALQNELAATQNTTDTLRAQAHEFSNRLHTISGLIELGEYDEVRQFITTVSNTQQQWHAEVSARIEDSAVAALLIAKASVAAEHSVGLRLSAGSRLSEVDSSLSADLVTVLGNLVDNAVDALGGARDGWIEVDISELDDAIRVVVRDSGPGVAPEIAREVFRNGFTTKAAEEGGKRGLGLALARQTCIRRQGWIDVHNEGGAVFTAMVPR